MNSPEVLGHRVWSLLHGDQRNLDEEDAFTYFQMNGGSHCQTLSGQSGIRSAYANRYLLSDSPTHK